MSLEQSAPKRWEIMELGEVVESSLYGLTAKAKEEIEGEPFLRITDINDNNELKETPPKKVDPQEHDLDKYQLEYGDIVVARSGATSGKSYAYKKEDPEMVYASYLIRFSLDTDRILPEYVQYFMKSSYYWHWVDNTKRKSAQANINAGEIKSLKIPVPPLEEQEIIVQKLDKIFDSIEEIQDAQEQAEEIQERLESIIASDIFNELDEETVKLKEVTEKITDGSHQTPDYTEDGVYFLRAGDVKENEIDWENLKNITEEEHERLSSRWPEKGDVLYTKNGTIGIAKAVDWEKEASIYVSLALIRPKEDLDTFYLEKFLNTDLALQQAKDRAKTVSVSNLHLEEIREMEIPLPSLEKQKKIVEVVENSHEKIRENQEFFDKRKKITEDLPKSVLAKAFKGDLVDFESEDSEEDESSSVNKNEESKSEFDGDGQQSLEQIT